MRRIKIALGSTRGAKVEAARACAARITQIDATWKEAEIIAIEVKTDTPAMPLTDEELMLGAKARAQGVGDA